MGKIIELREYKDNGEAVGLSFGQEETLEVNSIDQLLSFVEKTEGNCSLTINLPKSELVKAIAPLLELLRSSNPLVQKHVLEVLGNMEIPEVAPHIIPYCFQPDLYVRMQAVKSLKLLGQPTAVLPLKELLQEKNSQLKNMAAATLKHLVDDQFLLMMIAHEEAKTEGPVLETFFELISLFDNQELAKFSPTTIKKVFDFFHQHYEKSRQIEEDLLKKQWEAEAVASNLLQQKQKLKKSYSDSRLELEVFRTSMLPVLPETKMLPGATDDQASELRRLHTEYEHLNQENEKSKEEISNLLLMIKELEEQIETASTAEAEEPFLAEEALDEAMEEAAEEPSEETAQEHFDAGIYKLNEDILGDLIIDSHEGAVPKSASVVEFPQVLVMVEQNPAASEYMRSLLNHAGFPNIRSFLDGRLALEHVNQYHSEISLILAAQKMPQMDGLEFLGRIRAWEQEQSMEDCPVVMITEEINAYKLSQLTGAGATEVFPRLFIPEELAESIVRHSGAEGQNNEAAAKKQLMEDAKQHLARYCKLHKKRISLAFKNYKNLRAIPVEDEGFQTLFDKLIEFSVASAANNSRITLHWKSFNENGVPECLLSASFPPDEGMVFKYLEMEFSSKDHFSEGNISWESEANAVQVSLPYTVLEAIEEDEPAEQLVEDQDDEEIFDLLDELEEDDSDIQKIIGKLRSFCEEEPFRLFSVMDYLHDGHFERANQEILEMFQQLNRVDVIPYLIRRFQQLHKEYKLWTLSFIAEKDIKAGLYFIISVLRDQDEEVRHRALAVLLQQFDASFLNLLVHSFIRTFRLPRTLHRLEILKRLPARERSAFFQILLFNEQFEQSVPFLFGYLDEAAPFEQESIYIALAAQKSLRYLDEEQIQILQKHFEDKQVLHQFPRITVSLLLSTTGEMLEWIMENIKPNHWVEVFKPRFVEDVKSGWEAMGPFIQEGMQEILDHIIHADGLLFGEPLDEDKEKEIYRMFHMSKGVALSLDLEILVALYHSIESIWSGLTPNVEEKVEESKRLKSNFKCLLEVTKSADRIINLANQDDSFLLEKKALNSIFPRIEHLFNKLIAMLKKKAKLSLLEEKEFYFEPSVLTSLNEILIQLLKNSVDHGMETGEERTSLGKPEAGDIQVRIAEKDGGMEITVSDDGQGLNVEKIAQRCVEKELLTAKEAQAITADENRHPEVYDFIFASQFSTAQKASEVSGRGVGMDIIRSEVEGMGGIIRIESRRGKGSSFIIQIPVD
ncbi:MAG: HEAT repeat domain-containing protein [SAR324 cluster bacterium]|nr:HEAT repeat domain-containing protein [SAR324 cluster bacterium]